MPMIGPTLETSRLILRPPIQEDFESYAALGREEETMRFIGGVFERHTAWRFMAAVAGSWALLGHGMFSVIEKETNRWIGRIGPWYPGGEAGGWPGPEVGWGLIADAQGKGYAAEAATASIDYVFDELGWDHVIHCIHKDNAPSIRLAERLGSYLQNENTMLPPPMNVAVDVYGQTRDEWRAKKG